MSYLQGKTPISYLQELCTKRGITPQYDLIANEGAVHEPTFVFKVTAGEFIGTGKGPSKKKAKHNAALSVLNQMMGVANGNPVVEDFVSNTPQDMGMQVMGPQGDALLGNPVGELQEFTQKRLWPPPIYEYTSEQGPPHAREFICIVKLFKLQEQGVGKSKKVAKRQAAHAMLNRIKQGIIPPQGDGDGPEEYDEEGLALPMDAQRAAYASLKDTKVPTLTPQASAKISQFYQSLKNATGKHLQALQQQILSAPSVQYSQLLQEIAEEQRFQVTYVDIQEISHSGQRQCLVQLSSMPVAVCHGVGDTPEEAHAQAAHHALQYLKIMTKKI